MIAINHILCNLIGAAVFLQVAQVHDANVPRLPLHAWESDYARLYSCMKLQEPYISCKEVNVTGLKRPGVEELTRKAWRTTPHE